MSRYLKILQLIIMEPALIKSITEIYMIKNTFRFARCTLNKEGIDGRTETSRYIELVPLGYPPKTSPKSKMPISFITI